MWEKKGLDELDCHIPLLIRAPWIPAASSGVRTSAFAEAVDWMPTLIDLAGLPPCEELGTTNGVSLAPILRDPPLNGTGAGKKVREPFLHLRGAGPFRLGFPDVAPDLVTKLRSATLGQYAFSQFPRCNCTYATSAIDSRNGTCQSNYENAWTHETGAKGAANNHVCLYTPASQFDWMGYSIRAEAFRYSIFVEWNGLLLRPVWESMQSEELYGEKDLSTDFDSATFSEPLNLLAANPISAEAQRAVAELRPALIKQFSGG
jgi:hypothetical protein